MSTAGWIILLVLLLPMIGILIWMVIAASVVRIPSGSLGLLMVKGRATDTTLPPGTHFVPALRRRMIEEYPSVELAYRAGAQDPADTVAAGREARRALRPRTAVLIAAVLNVVGAFLSTEVAKTISGGIVNDAFVTPTMIFAGLVAAILWNLVTWLFGLPSSSSHALFGGLIGAVLVGAGVSGVNLSVVVSKILLPAVMAPVVAALAAGLATFLLYHWLRRADQEPAAGWFRRGQTVSGSMIALASGTSDGQKTMGVITLMLITGGYQAAGTGPQTWVIGCAGLAIGAGTYSGGWRIMRTMGKGLVDLHSPQGFAAETTSAAAILASAHMGFGLSTTQVWSGSVIGSGAGRKLSLVRWGTARRMMYGWMLTLPAFALFGAVAAAVALTGPFGW